MELSHMKNAKKLMVLVSSKGNSMGERHDLPRIIPQEKPTFFNQNAGTGAFWGNVVTGIPAGIAMYGGRNRLGIALAAAGTLIGGAWGAISGKTQLEKEQKEGRVVKDPGYMNRGIIAGIGIAFFVSFVPVIGIFVGALGIIIGAVAGSIVRNNQLQRDFDKAIIIRDQQVTGITQVQGHGKAQQPSYMNSVSASEAAELAAKQKATGSHGDRLEQQETAPELAASRG